MVVTNLARNPRYVVSCVQKLTATKPLPSTAVIHLFPLSDWAYSVCSSSSTRRARKVSSKQNHGVDNFIGPFCCSLTSQNKHCATKQQEFWQRPMFRMIHHGESDKSEDMCGGDRLDQWWAGADKWAGEGSRQAWTTVCSNTTSRIFQSKNETALPRGETSKACNMSTLLVNIRKCDWDLRGWKSARSSSTWVRYFYQQLSKCSAHRTSKCKNGKTFHAVNTFSLWTCNRAFLHLACFVQPALVFSVQPCWSYRCLCTAFHFCVTSFVLFAHNKERQ